MERLTDAAPPLDAAARTELARKAKAVKSCGSTREFDVSECVHDMAFIDACSPDVILALLAAVERGGADTARMDWWESERPRVGLGEDNVVRLLDRWNDGALLASEPTMREAIDAARSPQPGTDDGQ